jgi:hypothetical protein
VPNVSTLRSIRYDSNNMRVFKASGVGSGIAIKYKQLEFETNLRVVSAFGSSIHEHESNRMPKQ